MIGSAQHSLTKWLANILTPVVQLHSQHCISDSFTFANQIRKTSIDTHNAFFRLFDIVSLYTHVPLDETITIFADTFYCGNLFRNLSFWNWYTLPLNVCNSVLITQCTSCTVGWGCRIRQLHHCRGVRLLHWVSWYDSKQSDGEALVIVEFGGIWSTPSLPLLPGPL